MGLTLVEKQRASFIADQQRVVEKNLLKQLKQEYKIKIFTPSVARVIISRHS